MKKSARPPQPLRPLTADSAPFTVSDLAARWRSSPMHVIDLVEEGKLQAIDIGSNPSGRRYYRIPVESVIAFEANASSLNGSPNPQPRRATR